MQTDNAGKLTIEAVIPGDETVEYELHNRFAVAWVRGEWFDLTDEIDAYIAAIRNTERTA